MSKKHFFTLLLVLLVCGISTCWAGDTSLHDKDLAIHTYGGGKLLEGVFRSISMLIYGNSQNGLDQTFNGILRIALLIGGFCAFCLAFFREKFDPLIKTFFFPAIVVISCLLVPRTTIYIQDHLAEKSVSTSDAGFIEVKHIPFFLGKLASLSSTLSHKITRSLESVLHGTNDSLYNWTGHIYAGENIFLTKKCRIANPLLEENFREFCRECVYRDLGLGIYTKKELIESSNLLEFLGNHTSKIRTMFYRDHQAKDTNTVEGSFIPCREAIKNMNILFNKTEGNTKEILVGEIGNDFQYLLKQKNLDSKGLSNLIKQQIAINILKEEVPGSMNSFAAKRAELLQRENQKILGFLGAGSIVAMHNYLEALVYIAFPLIIIASLLSFGVKILLNWMQFVLWVSVWPPFYVLVKYLLDTIWTYRSEKAFGSSFTLTVFTSEGLSDLYGSMESIAFLAMASIPFLSWVLLKGGISQMAHFASTIMSPGQSAASTTAAEKVYGNYNLGNVNLDNVNAHNAQTFRQTYSGLLSSDSVSIDSGTETITYTPGSDALYIRQSDSYLREGISRTQAFSSAIQDSLSLSKTALMEKSQGYSESLSDSTNRGAGFVQALSKQFQMGENYNTQTTTGLQEAVQYMQGLGNDYAKSHGVSTDQGLKAALSAGIGFSFGLKKSIDGSYQTGITRSETESVLGKSFDSESFQKHLQTITNFSSGEVANVLVSEDARLHEDFVRSYNKTLNSSEQVRAAYTEQSALANLKSYSESDDVRIQESLNQRFVNFVQAQFQDRGKINDILDGDGEIEKREIMREFIKNFIPENSIGKTEEVMKYFENSIADIQKVSSETFSNDKAHLLAEGEEKLGLTFEENETLFKDLKNQVYRASTHDLETLNEERRRIELKHKLKSTSAKEAVNTSIPSHLWNKISDIYTAPKSSGVYHELYGFTEKPSEAER